MKNHISLIWHCVFMKVGVLIFIWVQNPKTLSLHQLDFCNSRYSSWNGWRSIPADCKIWLWRLQFPYSSLFYFLGLDFQKGMDVSFLFHWNHFILTSRTHTLHKTSIEGQICQLPLIYSFLHLSSKSAFKT